MKVHETYATEVWCGSVLCIRAVVRCMSIVAEEASPRTQYCCQLEMRPRHVVLRLVLLYPHNSSDNFVVSEIIFVIVIIALSRYFCSL